MTHAHEVVLCQNNDAASRLGRPCDTSGAASLAVAPPGPQAALKAPPSPGPVEDRAMKVRVRGLDFFYGSHQALFDNNIDIVEKAVTAIIGPSGCGKSTHIRAYNRVFELYREQRAAGEIMIDGENILDRCTDLLSLRRRVGMIF